MSRNVQLVLLCEDRQHEIFAKCFLEKTGWPKRRLRVELGPPGRGAAEQFVRKQFPIANIRWIKYTAFLQAIKNASKNSTTMH